VQQIETKGINLIHQKNNLQKELDMKKVKVGLVGLGFMGTTHFRIYDELDNAEVIAIADVNPTKLLGDVSSVIGNIGGGDNSKNLCLKNISTHLRVDDLINDPSIDIVDICVPTPDHFQIAAKALQKGKHVFCEKPVCRNIKEVDELQKIAKKSDKFFNVGMCIRAWPEYFHVNELYKSGALGKVRSVFMRRLSPDISGNSWNNWFMDGQKSGGALLDLHLHDSDFIRFMFGRPKAVTSFGVNSLRCAGGTDYVLTNYHFDDGVIAAEGGWCANKNVPFEMSFQMIFDKATVRFAGEGYKIYWENGQVESPSVGDARLPTGWHQELSYFVNCVENRVVPEKYQNFSEIADSFKIVMAEQESVDSGKIVFIKY
jgi:predicted dehydrogenase